MSTNTAIRRIAAILAVLLLPLAIGGVYFGTVAGRASAAENIKAAVVNLDEMATMDVNGTEQQLPGGRLVAADLTSPDAGSGIQLTWTLTDQAAADSGMKDGTYYAVVTIPKDFSAKLAKALQSPDTAVPATVEVEANTAASPLAGKYGQQDAQTATNAVSAMMTQQYLEGVFEGLSKMGEQITQATDGAKQLADGSTQVKSGLDQTSKGAKQAADGIEQYTGGVDQAAAGAKQAADGVSQYTGGVDQSAAGASQLSQGIGQLADKSGALVSGAKQLDSGVGKIQPGAKQLAGGASQLAAGAKTLDGGAASLATAAKQVAGGTKEFVAGVSDAAKATKTLNANTGPLVSGTKQLAEGAAGVQQLVGATKTPVDTSLSKIKQAGTDLGGAQQPMTDAGAKLKSAGGSLAAAGSDLTKAGGSLQTILAACAADPTIDATICGAAASAAGSIQDAGTSLTGAQGSLQGAGTDIAAAGSSLAAVGDDLTAAGTAAGTAQAIISGPTSSKLPVTLSGAAGQLASGTASLAKKAPELASGIQQLSSGMTALSTAGATLSSGAKQLASGVSTYQKGTSTFASQSTLLARGANGVAAGINQLKTGTSTLASQAPLLTSGIAQLNSGASQLSNGLTQLSNNSAALNSGTGQLSSGLSQLSENSEKLNAGASQLADGTSQLADGAGSLADGTKEFATGLSSAAGQVPSYTDSEVKQLATVVTTPVSATVAKAEVRTDDGNGSAAIIPIALWLGALGLFLLLRAVPRGVSFSSAGPARLALAGYLPGAVLMAVAAVVLAVAIPMFGIRINNWPAVLVLSVVGSLSFAALNQAFVALWGRMGSLLSLAFFALQFACLDWVVPLQAAPSIIRGMAPILPMSELGLALQGPMTGTAYPGSGTMVVGLIIWGIVGLAATAWVVRRAQTRAAVMAAPPVTQPQPA